MRIREVINTLTARIISEAGDPGQNDAAKNTRAKAKPQGDQKRADSPDRKKAMAPGDVKDQVVGGKGQGQEGGAVKRQVQQADKKRDRVGDAAADSVTKGTLDPKRNYGNGSEAEKASDKWAADVGEFDRNRKDKTKDNVKPKWTGDRDRWSDGEFASSPVDDPEIEAPGGKKLKYYNPAEIEQLRSSGDPFDAQIADAMERGNEEYMAQKEANKAARSEESKAKRADIKANGKKAPSKDVFSDSEKEMAEDALLLAKHAGKMDQNQFREMLKNKFGLDDAGVKRLIFVMRDLHSKKMKSLSGEHRDDLSDEEKEMGNANVATGGRRGSLEVSDMVRRSNQSGAADLTPQEVDELATQAGQGDQNAQEMLFQKMARMLYGVARKYSFGDNEKLADMYGEAKAAMMQAFNTFDQKGGAGFSTWLYKNVSGLVQNAAYADRNNIRLPGDKAQEVAKMKQTMQQVRNAGFDGVDADMEVISRMGLKSWAEYDKLKQLAQSQASLSTPVQGEEGDEGGSIGDNASGGVHSEYTSAEDQAVGTGASPDADIDAMQKELATSDKTMSDELMNALYDRANVPPEDRQIVNSLFGIGGEEPMTDSEVQAVYGLTNYSMKNKVQGALTDMAKAIAAENGTSPQEELQNLLKIMKNRKMDYQASQYQRATDDGEGKSAEQRNVEKARRQSRERAASAE